ncbi:Exosome complex component Rrp42 [Candidatus Methanobinarius endosymbioticus]|uniref:Exosome complex component Rrp42 n=1 Tax=Candidatus Methanobinarius endosymbioticus TaxID=2006182 RepID=A0A366M9N7_9EURY|nr:Exosome complex component Rrp42 [Candidatus Methanobinarius endosymbioticus]
MNIIPEITRECITDLINNNQREDGRNLDEYRDIGIETGIISKAAGSARVKIGNSQVIVGIKPQLGEPFPDTPDVGVLMTNGEMLPMADPKFEAGPPSEASVELARVVDRGIREIVDLEKLCIEPGKKVWMLFIDLHIIDFDGNLFDTATLAVLSALKNTKLPVAKMVDDESVINEETTMDLPLRGTEAMCTFVKIGENVVLDPSLDEEAILDARLSIGITDAGSICAMQKGGDKPLTKDDILEAVSTAYSKVPTLIEKVKNA